MVEADQRDAHLEAAEELLREAMTVEKDNRRILVLLATVILDRGGDLEQAQWLLKQNTRQGGGRRRRREDPAAVMQRARLFIRQEAYDETERLLQRLLKSDTAQHGAHAIQAELHMARGQLLLAHASYKTARERCPIYAPEGSLYDTAMASLQVHIEAGHAVIQVAASPTEANVPQAQAGTREGSTILRRRENAEDTESAEEATDSLTATAPAEVTEDADTVPVEAVVPAPEAATDAVAEAVAETEAEVVAEAAPEADVVAQAPLDAEVVAESEVVAEAEAEVVAETEAAPEAEAEGTPAE
jgi:SWI/SNF-related matrix-associated actin-dependent regulator 1 of chromatin subfamily A